MAETPILAAIADATLARISCVYGSLQYPVPALRCNCCTIKSIIRLGVLSGYGTAAGVLPLRL